MKNTIDNMLKKAGACDEAKEWAKGKSWNEIFRTCPRGDWMLWLFQRTNFNDDLLLTLAKGRCAYTVIHLMKHRDSIKAVKAAILYGKGKLTKADLKLTATAAHAAAHAATCPYSTADAADYAAFAAYTNAIVSATIDAGNIAKQKNQLLTANICRKILRRKLWNIKFDK